MLKETLTYTGRIWINKLDSLVGKGRNGRYYRKYRLIHNNDFYTMTIFADKASDLFSLPETFVVRNLPVYSSEYRQGDKTYTVYSTELSDLIACMKQ
ncbi:hypothetical protein [Escherichia coli]|uniref:hypothetical protein n=1 Tax=Escherichia coli TaxID=562 RepID=UPI000F065B57|nr:hypothetical protein [Escherichia coli]